MGRTRTVGLALRALLATVISGAVLVGSLAVVVTVAVVAGMALTSYVADVSSALGLDPPEPTWPVVWAVCAASATVWFARAIHRTIRAERATVLDGTIPVTESGADGTRVVDAAVDRLARQVDLPKPALRIRSTATPVAYTTYRADDPIVTTGRNRPVVVVSRGLLEALSESELSAVLAHELAHVANDDLRLMTGVLVPLVAAETLTEEEGYPSSAFDCCGRLLGFGSSIGVGTFSRGRELAADRAAATITGDPAALASALEAIVDAGSAEPTTDLREHARSTNAISVLPTLGDERVASGLRSTHPPLETRLERLRSMAAD